MEMGRCMLRGSGRAVMGNNKGLMDMGRCMFRRSGADNDRRRAIVAPKCRNGMVCIIARKSVRGQVRL